MEELNQQRPTIERRPIKSSPSAPERQPLILVVCGMKSIGKTHYSVEEIDKYVNGTHDRSPRKALILDFSEDDMYDKYSAVHPQYVRALKESRGRRILPYEMGGKPYTLDKMKDVAEYVIFNYKDGLLVLEDIDKYLYGNQGRSLIGALTTNRHSGLDIIITHQSLSKVTQNEWQNAAFLRLHHQLDSIERLNDGRLPNYPLLKIAQIIVDRRYYQAVDDMENEVIGEKEFIIRRGFFVHINMFNHKVIGCKKEEFDSASMRFVRENPSAISKRMKIGDEMGRPIPREEAMKRLYSKYSMYYGGETM